VLIGSILCLVGLIGAAAMLAGRHRARLHEGMTRVAAVSAVGGTAVKRATSSGAGTTARHVGTSVAWTRTTGGKVAGTTKRASAAAFQAGATQVGELKSRTAREPDGEAPEAEGAQTPPPEVAAPEPARSPEAAEAAAPVTKPKPKPKPARLTVAAEPGETAPTDEPPSADGEPPVETAGKAEAPEAAGASETPDPAQPEEAPEPAETEEPPASAPKAGSTKGTRSSRPAGTPAKPRTARPARKRQQRRSRRR
jgi:hypothetical protein